MVRMGCGWELGMSWSVSCVEECCGVALGLWRPGRWGSRSGFALAARMNTPCGAAVQGLWGVTCLVGLSDAGSLNLHCRCDVASGGEDNSAVCGWVLQVWGLHVMGAGG